MSQKELQQKIESYWENKDSLNLTDVDLHSNATDLKQKIERLVKMKKFFPACDYCVGRPKDPTTAKVYDGTGMIEPGIQAPKPISYKELT